MNVRYTKTSIGLMVAIIIVVSTLRNSVNLKSQTLHQGDNRLSTLPPFLPQKNSSKFRPVTSLASRAECVPSPYQPLVWADDSNLVHDYTTETSKYWNITISSRTTTNDDTTVMAVCEFLLKNHANHFAHTLQQLYGCFSYWQDYADKNKNETTQPILLVSHERLQTMNQNPFLSGFLQVMQSQLRLQIMGKRQFLEQNHNQTIVTIGIEGSYLLTHAQEFNRLVQKHYSFPNEDDDKECLAPRISILNRHKPKGRSIINAIPLVDELNKDASLKDYDNTTIAPKVQLEYFEGKSFREQALVFHNTDILIAPHGAQLTGLPLLASSPATCSQLIELFPKEYGIPNFFGSLAIQSGIRYAFVYLSDQSLETEEQAPDLNQRIRARSTNLCPSIDYMVKIVQESIRDWQECCRHRREQGNPTTA